MELTIKPIREDDREFVRIIFREYWGSTQMVTRGKVLDCDDLPGLIAWDGIKPVGVITYLMDGDECELTSLNSIVEGRGIATALIEEVKEIASGAGCRKICVETSNDNIDAMQFYIKRGFRLVEVFLDAITEARKIKPDIPMVGKYGIELKDAIEFEMQL